MRDAQFNHESGYAMLLVFFLAAIIAVALYSELPRVAFEAQRAKEQLLIERGEQYKRAIQLFVRKAGRYPATIEELESLNNMRFLRKRYLDPMTGKEKWRLIHINGGVLTDSVVGKNKVGQVQQPPNANTFIGEGPAIGAANDTIQPQINPAMQRRASDDRPVVTQELPDPPAPAPAQQQENPAIGTAAAPAVPGTPVNAPDMQNRQTPGVSPNPLSNSSVYVAPSLGQPVANGDQLSGGIYVAPSLGQPPDPNAGLPPGSTGLPGHGDVLGNRDARNLRAIQQTAALTQAAASASSTPAGQNPDGSNAGNLSPAGSTDIPPPAGLPGMGGTQIGGGIAGVASESTGPAIKIYNERKKYNEWEFVYDQSKDRGLAGVQHNGGAPGTSAQSMGSIPGQQPQPQPSPSN